ncbi:MAG: 2-oxo acid dehydrogenase subunit E2 [Pirellulaceae bacterium]|nr:hypothetical protein [Planctomycetaceae bacterium]
MPIEIIVPRLGWSMDEGTFVEWLKNDKDFVNAGDMLFVLEGEKASQEIESFDAGSLHIPADAPLPGDTVAVGQRLAYLLAEGESPPAAIKPAALGNAMVPNSSDSPGNRAAGPAARRLARKLEVDIDNIPTPDPTGRVSSEDVQVTGGQGKPTKTVLHKGIGVVATPRARRTARELGIDWRTTQGSGRNGRVRQRDILATRQAPISSSNRLQLAALPKASGTQQPPNKIRRTIAQRMLAGVQQTAPVTLNTKVEASELFTARQQCKSRDPENAPSYNDMLVMLVAASLPESPELNACWVNDSVYTFDEINVAIAMDTPRGLLAPVLRNVAASSLKEITAESRRLAEQASLGNLSEDQLAGGTFTLTNLGMFDVDHFTPIINLPQTAILGIGRLADEPVVADGRVVPGKSLSLSLTFDHRVIDGAPAARWLQRLSEMIRQFSRYVIE